MDRGIVKNVDLIYKKTDFSALQMNEKQSLIVYTIVSVKKKH